MKQLSVYVAYFFTVIEGQAGPARREHLLWILEAEVV